MRDKRGQGSVRVDKVFSDDDDIGKFTNPLITILTFINTLRILWMVFTHFFVISYTVTLALNVNLFKEKTQTPDFMA